MTSLDPDRQVSLMLCESILHLLVEERVITKERALETIKDIVQLVRESDEIGERCSTSSSALQLIEAIAHTFALTHTFALKGQDEFICLPAEVRCSRCGSVRPMGDA
jgi:hypothetical protein